MKHISFGSLKSIRLFLCFSLIIIEACSSASSLNIYQGKLSDLFPETVNDYKRTEIGPHGMPLGISQAKERLQVIEDARATYVSSSNNKVIEIAAINFSSPDNAKEALRIFKQGLEPNIELKEVGEKKKGGSTVGERLSIDRTKNRGRVESINLWTNGSVLFFVKSYYPDRNENYVPSNATDVREFENSFPY